MWIWLRTMGPGLTAEMTSIRLSFNLGDWVWNWSSHLSASESTNTYTNFCSLPWNPLISLKRYVYVHHGADKHWNLNTFWMSILFMLCDGMDQGGCFIFIESMVVGGSVSHSIPPTCSLLPLFPSLFLSLISTNIVWRTKILSLSRTLQRSTIPSP